MVGASIGVQSTDVFPDGDFVMLRGPGPGTAREIVLVQHWFEEVKLMMLAR